MQRLRVCNATGVGAQQGAGAIADMLDALAATGSITQGVSALVATQLAAGPATRRYDIGRHVRPVEVHVSEAVNAPVHRASPLSPRLVRSHH